ncbi:MAG: YhgE/Pip family protein [Oscillospiraceae bacterium]|jgi:putative membrane protein|nr:YhgE/Pip family protein [Oscillospiraceae bacterium]
MNAIQIFLHGLKQSLRKPTSAFATLMILIVPLMYPLFWLQAFWNPYANVDKMPVAFVSKCAVGDALSAQLQTSDYNWTFTDRETAEAGLKNKDYYAVFVVTDNTNIEVISDSKNNFMATLLANQIAAKLKDNITAQISQVPDLISVSTTDLNPIANTGTGFAPYFSSLALWIGALLISLVVGRRVDKKMMLEKGGVTVKSGASLALGRFMLFALCGIAQAALLTGILFLLGITVQNGLLTFVALAVSSLCCVALVSMLIGIFGMLGQMLSMFLLIFQLTASGGTFPTELTQGGFFIALHPFVPFTYSVNALRETISGVPLDSSVLTQSLGVQLGVAVIAVLLYTGIEILRGRKQAKLAEAA